MFEDLAMNRSLGRKKKEIGKKEHGMEATGPRQDQPCQQSVKEVGGTHSALPFTIGYP